MSTFEEKTIFICAILLVILGFVLHFLSEMLEKIGTPEWLKLASAFLLAVGILVLGRHYGVIRH